MTRAGETCTIETHDAETKRRGDGQLKESIDLVLICPGDPRLIFQDLAADYAAIEPPVWGAMLAQAAQVLGFRVELVDQVAEGLTPDQIALRAHELAPRLAAIVVYGHQPSASTQNMTMAETIADTFADAAPEIKTILIGGHPSALPERTLSECRADFVAQGEGVYTLEALLELDRLDDAAAYPKVPGLWWRENERTRSSVAAPVVPERELATALPGMAWDLLPMKAYRAHNWHCFDHIRERQPYASLYTSLGCPYRCSFCCINAPFGKSGLRCWDPAHVINELDILANRHGVGNVKIADEMFVLNEQHVTRLCDLIIERGHRFNFWAYGRVDTVHERLLEKMKRAGFNWLCLGIESRSEFVRDGVRKGEFSEEDIYRVVETVKGAGIHVIGNFIFGLPDDTLETMQSTLDMAIELNCEMANFYCATAYPGSELYRVAIEKGWVLPEKWQDYSQHSYEQLPLPTGHLTAGAVLSFRDQAWRAYFTHPRYLSMIERTFGPDVVAHIHELTNIRLRRKHVEEGSSYVKNVKE